jgi:HK97 family phage prohead protease
MQIEGRMVHEPVTAFRADGEPTKLDGYAAVFSRETVIGDLFREVIEPGAFKDAVKDGDVRGLFNHDPNLVLGRTSSKTMTLREDAKGLHYVIESPDTTVGRDVMALVQRGDVTGSSFAFTVRRDSWTRPSKPGELPLRTIHEVEWLRDVGPVTFPAFEETSVQARDAAAATIPLEEPTGDLAALSRARAEIAVAEIECL